MKNSEFYDVLKTNKQLKGVGQTKPTPIANNTADAAQYFFIDMSVTELM